MFSYKIEANENNQWTEVHGWVRPFTDGQTLDESLDSGKINLSFVTRSKPYAPFTRIRISVYEGEDTSSTPVEIIGVVMLIGGVPGYGALFLWVLTEDKRKARKEGKKCTKASIIVTIAASGWTRGVIMSRRRLGLKEI